MNKCRVIDFDRAIRVANLPAGTRIDNFGLSHDLATPARVSPKVLDSVDCRLIGGMQKTHTGECRHPGNWPTEQGMASKHHADCPLRILVVEDNQSVATVIGEYLELSGHVMDFAIDGVGGLHLALTQPFDAIVLDIELPKMDGMTFCRKLRAEGGYETPVLMVTGRDNLSDKLEGFEAGADDYLVKPFALEELKARLLALVRRKEKNAPLRLQVEDLVLDLGTMRVERDGQEIQLCRIQMKILTILMKSYPNVVSRDELAIALWGDQPPGSDVLRSHIYALRKAIDKPFGKSILETVRGIGYKIVGPETTSG